ncbi:MAG: type II toxin-antitoxin system HicB family antitoxin [Gammaproteobacteria bacterium]
MHNVKYVVYKEGQYYVSQCLNVDVSSFGDNIDSAVENLREALELYFEVDGISGSEYMEIGNALIGEATINV